MEREEDIYHYGTNCPGEGLFFSGSEKTQLRALGYSMEWNGWKENWGSCDFYFTSKATIVRLL